MKKGSQHTRETKLRLSSIKKGRPNKRKGMPQPWHAGDNNPAKRVEVREKLRKAMIGRVPWNVGIPRSNEDKIKISIANKGRIASEKTKNRLRETLIRKYGSFDKSIIENPPNAYRFRPEAPFDMYYGGTVHIRKNDKKKRRQVTLYGIDSTTGRRIKYKTLFSLVLHRIDVFRKTGKDIPEGNEVHHRDHNSMNDTFTNLMNTSHAEHKKSHIKQMNFICPVCKILFTHYELFNHNYTQPLCCSTMCKLTLDMKLPPYEKSIELRKQIAEQQVIFTYSHYNFIKFNLQEAIDKSTKL